ncbi:MAG TPA: beta-ketoacyl-[acyl-carrier-protein] synthase family protein [Candidatus Paceibacterota bacterium]|nr:beta-ketoacyl-[acyl-carrier-protein] synthase family protein [Candidatus Paceibacterota bacterium]
MRDVVITAIAGISGNGNSMREIYTNMLQGRVARAKIFDYPRIWAGFPDTGTAHEATTDLLRPFMRDEGLVETVCGSPLTNDALFGITALKEWSSKEKAHSYDRHQLFAHVAAKLLFDRVGGVEMVCERAERFGIVGGTGNGGLTETYPATLLLEQGKKLGPRANIRELPNTFVGMIANRWGIKGPGDVGVTACAASSNGFINAVRMIRLDEADAVLVIGTEAVINPFGIASFVSQRALSNQSRPYQKDRSGFLMGEGAAAILVESRDNATYRGATVLAHVAGYGSTTDGNAEGAITSPDPTGGERSAKLALEMAGIGPEDLTYINTHGTGTPDGDKAELEGIRSWAGDFAKKILISSTKSFSGHLLGAAGAFELALCTMMLQEGYILPTYGLTPENVDPELADFNHVMQTLPMFAHTKYILSNSFGFGGANASVILERPD